MTWLRESKEVCWCISKSFRAVIILKIPTHHYATRPNINHIQLSFRIPKIWDIIQLIHIYWHGLVVTSRCQIINDESHENTRNLGLKNSDIFSGTTASQGVLMTIFSPEIFLFRPLTVGFSGLTSTSCPLTLRLRETKKQWEEDWAFHVSCVAWKGFYVSKGWIAGGSAEFVSWQDC